MTVLLIAVFMVLSFGGVGFFVAAVVQNRRRQREVAWQQVAEARGLQFTPGSWTSGPSISGAINGFFVTVHTHRSGEDEHVTRYAVAYPSMRDRPIELTKESGFHFTIVKRVLRTTDVEIGDPEFDDRVLIDASDPVAAARYLSPARRQAVLRVFDHGGFRNPKISDTAINVDTVGVESDATTLHNVLTMLLSTAATMSAPNEVDLAARGDLPAPPASVDGPKPADEATAADEPIAVETSAPTDAPALPVEPAVDPEPIQDAPPVTAQTTDTSPSETPPIPLRLDQDAVLADLFDSGRMGFDTESHFDETYAGQRVQWTGEVDSVRPYRSDPDFDRPGLQATILLTAADPATFRSSRVRAVVQVDEDTPLDRRDQVTFSGTLRRVDRYMNKLFIANGSIDTRAGHNT